MTKAEQEKIDNYLTCAKQYLEYASNGSYCSIDEPFVPEVAGMVEQLGTILSGVKAGFFTQEAPKPAKTTKSQPKTKGFFLDENTESDEGENILEQEWICNICMERLEDGDYVDRLSSDLRHVNCNEPQG